MDQPPPAGALPSTHWTVVLQAGRGSDEVALEALEQLLRRYRQPLLEHLAWRFAANPEQAEDWLHDFIEKKVLRKMLLACANRKRGRFRTFLLNALDNHVVDELRHAGRDKRQPPGGFVSLDALTPSETPVTSRGGPDPFDVAWARAVVSEAVAQLEAYYRSKGRHDLWGVFAEGLLEPVLADRESPAMAVLARRHGFASAAQASNGLTTAKRMFRQMLELAVGEYAEGIGDVAEEIQDLLAILERGG